MESIWKKDASLPEFPRLEGDLETDILVIGGGLAGLLCAWELSRAGVRCVLAEADRLCRGVTGNTTAKITSQHGLIYHKLLQTFGAEKAALYYQANQAALERYRTLCRELDCEFEEKDAFVYDTGNPKKLEKELSALERIGAEADFAEKLPLPFPTAGAVRFPRQAQFHPLKFAAFLCREPEIYEHTPVLEWDGRTWRTPHGRIRARKTIVATHFPFLNRHGAFFLKLSQHRSYVLALENAADVAGMYVSTRQNGLSFRNRQGLLLLGGGGHRTGKKGSGWTEPEAAAREFYPGARIRGRWATQDCMTLDGIPYIGQYSAGTPELFVATGFGKWGMTSSMVASELLRDLVLERENRFAPVFSPSRGMLHPKLAVNAAEAVWNLLTPTRPRCPHLGCALKWNPWEHSWDCPCHGSRFDADGHLLDNPATGDLKRKPGH